MNEPWAGPEPEEEEWRKPEPLPLPPARKPNILPVKTGGIFPWIGSIVMPPEPKCPRCAGVLVYRRKDDAGWCRPCDRAFYHRSVVDLLHAAGIWFL